MFFRTIVAKPVTQHAVDNNAHLSEDFHTAATFQLYPVTAATATTARVHGGGGGRLLAEGAARGGVAATYSFPSSVLNTPTERIEVRPF